MRSLMGMLSIYSGVDQLGIVGKKAHGIFVQERGPCFRMVASGQIQATQPNGEGLQSSSSLGNRQAT